MSNELQQSVFDYGVLPINDAIELKASAERIKLRLKRTAEDIIEIGKELILSKKRCGHGGFEKWIESEFDMTDRSARNFMQVAETFGDKTEIISVFKPTALYALSSPSFPEDVRAEVLQRAEAGEKVDSKEIERLKKLNTTLEKKLNEQVEHNEGLSADLLEASEKNQNLERELTETKANQNAIIEAKTAEANAKAILDAQAEIARVKGELNAAIEKQKSLEKEHKQELSHKVNVELQKHKTEIDQRQYQITQLEKNLSELQAVKAELDAQVGDLKIHKDAIAEIKTALLTIKSQVLFAQDAKKIPSDVLNDWSFIADALGQLKSDVEKFVDLDGVLEAEIIELVSKSGVNDEALAA
jgi:DNA repair exonuclease SbcCD ATPase subunit